MGKGRRSKNQSKRSLQSLPRGIPQRPTKGSAIAGGTSPFEYARTAQSATKVKHFVHNRVVPGQKWKLAAGAGSVNERGVPSSLARSIQRRKLILRSELARQGKANEFVDRRIGEAGRSHGDHDGDSGRTKADVMLKRIVQERVRRSKRQSKFSLEDDDGDVVGLTHRVSQALVAVAIFTPCSSNSKTQLKLQPTLFEPRSLLPVT